MLLKIFITLTLLQFACKYPIEALRFNLLQDEPELPVFKPGFCPREFIRQNVCETQCNSDVDCPGSQKCCVTDCGGRACAKLNDGLNLGQEPLRQAKAAKLNNKCPAVSLTNQTKNCVNCQSNDDCLSGQLCCQAAGCKRRTCLNLTPQTRIPKAQKNIKKSATQDYYYTNDYGYNQADIAYSYNLKNNFMHQNLNRMSAVNNFQGPLVNLNNGPLMPRHVNPIYKLEKTNFVNNKLPRFNIHPMALRFKKANGKLVN